MSTDTFRLQYLARTAAGVPRDLANTFIVSKIKPIRPTVLIYNCTFVCDAKCEMCNNWKRGDRKSDMSLEQLDGAMHHDFWGALENLNISGGEPTTRLDLPEMVELFHRRLAAPAQNRRQHDRPDAQPRHSDAHAHREVLRRARSADQHSRVARRHRRHPQPGAAREERLRQGRARRSRRCRRSRREHSNFQFGIAATIFQTNLEDAKNILDMGAGARSSTSSSTCCGSPTTCSGIASLEENIGFKAKEEEFMRQFFLERVQEESVLSGQAFMYLHYADMIANGYKRTMPCPFRTQGLLLNPDGTLFYCENSKPLGNVLDDGAEALYFKAEHLVGPRDLRRDHLQELPEPLPGQRRRHEAVRAVCEVPGARLPGEEGSRSGTSRHYPSHGEQHSRQPVGPPGGCHRPAGVGALEERARRDLGRTSFTHNSCLSPARSV